MHHLAEVAAFGGEDFTRQRHQGDSALGALAHGRHRGQPQVTRLLLQIDQASGADLEHARCVAGAYRQGFTQVARVDANGRAVGHGDAPAQRVTACGAPCQQAHIAA